MTTKIDELDVDKLATYLTAAVPGFKGPITATKFDGGQSNPTFKIEAASGEYVLRRQPPGKLLPSAHAVDREFRVMSALAGTEVPVPPMIHLCEDKSVIGSMFFLMDYCKGDIYWNPSLPEKTPAQRSAMYAEMSRVLAALHSVNVEAVGLADYGRPGNYFERQLSRWTKQYRASEIDPIPAMDELIAWLEKALPEDDGQVSLVHGDFRLDNFMWHPNEEKIMAMLDWELSTLGHPFSDIAYQCMQLRMPADNPIGIPGLDGLDRTELGIPTEEEYVRMYCERRGIDSIPNWSFYLAFNFFRFAAIAQGVAKRALDGNASNKRASLAGKAVEPLAQAALNVIHQNT